MAKNEISDYDETDSGNTDISGITLSDATLIDALDNIARAQMGALKRWFKSSLFRLRDNTDQTKLLAFDLSGITTATTRTLTAPNASGTLMLTSTELANAQALDGSIVQTTHEAYTTNADLGTNIPFDDTVPRWDEGNLVLTAVHTPLSTTNKLRCRFSAEGSVSVLGVLTAAMYIDPADVTTLAVRTCYVTIPTGGYGGQLYMEYEYTPGVTTLQGIYVRVGANSGTARLNGNSTGRIYGGTLAATLTIEEIKA